jgi:GNAT superfamily N-acetyltransferase
VVRPDIDAAPARELIGALDHELAQRYPEEPVHEWQVRAAEVAPGQGAFFVAFRDQEPVGCGALRRLDESAGEIKRMYVLPAHRGQGVARRILQAIEAEATALAMEKLLLETGIRQPEAVALYQRAGYRRVPPFGTYTENPLSLCLAKDLRKGAGQPPRP